MLSQKEKEAAEKSLQKHLDKVIREVTRIETTIMIEGTDLSIGRLEELYKRACELEGVANWLINLSKRINPPIIKPVGSKFHA